MTSPWGAADEIGRLNWMTPESQAAALRGADASRPYDLAVDYFMGMPSWVVLGDPKYDIWLTHTPQGEGHAYAGTAISMYSHVGTSICSLNHLGGRDGTFWNGWTDREQLGSRAWRVGGNYPPIIARAVLLDVAAVKGVECLPDSYAITSADLLDAGGEALTSADVAIVRTGRMSRWSDADAFMGDQAGLGMDGARWLAEKAEVMCVCVDAGGEALPAQEADSFLPVHSYLLAEMGVPIIENVWLEELAGSGASEFALLAFPLKLLGSTGLPVRPVALPRGRRNAPIGS
jgi:kynurenine formamidase